MLRPLFSLIGVAVSQPSGATERPRTASTASVVAERLGLRVAYGDPSLDLARELQVRLAIDPLYLLTGQRRIAVRLEGEREGRRIEVLHAVSNYMQRNMFGLRMDHETRDVRASVYGRGPLPPFELTSPSQEPLGVLPVATEVPGGAEGACTLRTLDAHALRSVSADLAELASVGGVHLSCDGRRLSVIEAPHTGFMSLHLDRFLPVMERIVSALESDEPFTDPHGALLDPASMMSFLVDPKTPVTLEHEPYTTIATWIGAALARLEALLARVSEMFFGRAREEPAQTELGALLAVFPALGSRIVLREQGFERWVGSRQTSARYADVASATFANGLLSMTLRSGERVALDGPAAAQVHRALPTDVA